MDLVEICELWHVDLLARGPIRIDSILCFQIRDVVPLLPRVVWANAECEEFLEAFADTHQVRTNRARTRVFQWRMHPFVCKTVAAPLNDQTPDQPISPVVRSTHNRPQARLPITSRARAHLLKDVACGVDKGLAVEIVHVSEWLQ